MALIAAGTIVLPTADASPGRDIRVVQEQVRDLEMQAASAAEKYKEAAARLTATTARQSDIQSRIQGERDELAAVAASAGDLARGAYMSGGLDLTVQVLLAENPTDFLAQAAVLDSVASAQAARLRLARTVQLRLAQSEAELADQGRIATSYRDEMDAAKEEADTQLAKAQDLLGSLEEDERRRLAAIESQQHLESEAAARQASQAWAATSGSGPEASSAGGGSPGGSRAQSAVAFALSRVGAAYSYSANPPTSWDCSKLTAAAWAQGGVGLTALSYAQWDQVRHIPDSELQPGDLVFYFGGGAHHVALYIGNGKMVSASNPSDGVELIDYKGPWYAEHYSGAGRVVG